MRTFITLSILWIIQTAVPAQQYILPAANSFEQVKATGNLHIQLIVSDRMQLGFEGTQVPEDLDISWGENSLSLKTRTELSDAPALQVKLFFTTLSALEVRRGAVVQSADIINVKDLSLRAETGGKVEFEIVADSISARVNQGADIILRGTTRSQLIDAYTFGNYLGYELYAQNTWVKAATGAQVKVYSSEYLDANATSKAFVGYLGNPGKKEFRSTVGGTITQQSQ